MERRLAAILAADVVGYTRLMGADETGVLATLQALRAEVIDPLIREHNGRIVKLMGDGTLVEFHSVVDAVTCASKLQQSLASRNKALSTDKQLVLRIGINLGDVIVDGSDLYGDGVNVAARLESIAEPGSIYVSQTVRNHSVGKAPVSFEFLGERHLKNVSGPVRVYRVDTEGTTRAPRRDRRYRPLIAAGVVAALALAGTVAWEMAFRTPPAGRAAFDEAEALALPSGPTLAVLPFENLSGDPAQAYLGDGLSEDAIVELGRFRDLNVLSRQSTAAYRDKAFDVREIGKALGADYVLEGSVRKTGDRLRVTARLNDASTGTQVWAGAFNEILTAANLFDVQIRITEQVVSEIADSGGAIKRIDARRARTKPPEQLTSYECSMQQWQFFDDPALQRRVHDCILRVVEDEPDYWRGWTQLAEALRTEHMLFTNYYEGTPAEKLQRALDAARRAVALNPESPRAFFILGHILLLKGDREGFYDAAEIALSLGGDRRIEGQIGYWFVWTGRLELGAALLRRTIELNPSQTQETWFRGLADYHFVKGDYEEALKSFRKRAQPDNWWSVALELAILTKLGRTEEARAARDHLYELRPGITIADIVWSYRRFQRPDAQSAGYVEAFRAAGLAEGNYSPLEIGQNG